MIVNKFNAIDLYVETVSTTWRTYGEKHCITQMENRRLTILKEYGEATISKYVRSCYQGARQKTYSSKA